MKSVCAWQLLIRVILHPYHWIPAVPILRVWISEPDVSYCPFSMTEYSLERSFERGLHRHFLFLDRLKQICFLCPYQGDKAGGFLSHVPYRNSMLTTVLRDSLGGNTNTAMIATMAAAVQQLDETVSTCRFAQRVARVSNKVGHVYAATHSQLRLLRHLV